VQQQQANGGLQQNGQHARGSSQGNSYNQNPRDSHHSNYSANGASSGGGGGGGYSVANTQNYLGKGAGGYSNYSDDERGQRADDDMW
jgi:hypothetical protein